MNLKIVVCVVGFNRPISMRRLLNSLIKVETFSDELDIYISIDHASKDHDNIETIEVAKDFKWSHGEKKLNIRSANLGLRQHIIKCANECLSEYDAMIMLEDDLLVSPYMYHYVKSILTFYNDEKSKQIAGFSLYAQKFNEAADIPFEAISDGYDNFYFQIASSWGQLWTKKQWESFYSWYQNIDTNIDHKLLPNNIANWSEKSWKKYFIYYMIINDLYFVFPRESLSTNCGDLGTHFSKKSSHFHVSLQNGEKPYHFSKLSSSYSIYDVYGEITPLALKRLNPNLASYDFGVDIYGIKDLNNFKQNVVFSTKKLINKPWKSFSYDLKPHEQNIVFELDGNDIHFAPVEFFINKKSYIDRYRLMYEFLCINKLKYIIRIYIASSLKRLTIQFEKNFDK